MNFQVAVGRITSLRISSNALFVLSMFNGISVYSYTDRNYEQTMKEIRILMNVLHSMIPCTDDPNRSYAQYFHLRCDDDVYSHHICWSKPLSTLYNLISNNRLIAKHTIRLKKVIHLWCFVLITVSCDELCHYLLFMVPLMGQTC